MLLSKPKQATQTFHVHEQGRVKGFSFCLPPCQGHPEGEHGGGADPRRERHPPEEPGHQLPAHERPRGRRGCQGPDCCHHGQGEASPSCRGKEQTSHLLCSGFILAAASWELSLSVLEAAKSKSAAGIPLAAALWVISQRYFSLSK